MYTERIDSHAVEVLLGIYMYTILTRFMKFFSIRSTTVLGTMEETHESVCKSYVRTYKNCTLFTRLDATLVLLPNKNPGFCWVRSFDKFDAWSYINSVASLWDSKDDFLSKNEGDLFASAEENQSMRSFTSFSNPFTCALNSIVSIHPCWKRSRLCKVTILTIWHDDKNWATKRSPLKAPCSCWESGVLS